MNKSMEWLEKLSNKEVSFADAKQHLSKNGDRDEVKPHMDATATKSNAKEIKVLIDSSDGDKVRIKVPLCFAKGLLAFSPKIVKNTSFDETDLDLKAVLQMLEEGVVGELVDIESSDGDRVKIVVE